MNSKQFQQYLDEELPKVKFEKILHRFSVIIEEHISSSWSIEATSIEEAMEIAKQKYDNGEFVVDAYNAPTAKLMQVENEETGEQTEWEEF